jgi:exodeoxyribonuclease VII small subunit
MELNLNYEDAFLELKEIEAEIINETVTIDALAEKIKRASVLIQFCKTRLRATEEEVNNVIGDMGG